MMIICGLDFKETKLRQTETQWDETDKITKEFMEQVDDLRLKDTKEHPWWDWFQKRRTHTRKNRNSEDKGTKNKNNSSTTKEKHKNGTKTKDNRNQNSKAGE